MEGAQDKVVEMGTVMKSLGQLPWIGKIWMDVDQKTGIDTFPY